MRIRVLAAMAVAIAVSTVVSGQEAATPRATWSEVVTGGKPDEIKVEQVRHYTDRTEVDIDVRARGRIGIGEKVALEAGDAQYAAKGARGIELGKQVDLGVNMTNKKFTIQFEPIGEGVKMFNMRDQYGLRIYAIREGGKETGVVDTYWRDEASGDWVLGVAERHVVVNNRIEKIAKMTNKGDEWRIETERGTKVEIGKEKRGSEGQRKIKIGGRAMTCSKIAGEALPEYPNKDMREWKDNGYRSGDTVTIIGWLKDCPKIERMISLEFGVTATSIVMSREEISAYGKMDAEGQFVVKMPVENTQEVYMDWQRSHLRSVVEPGETYVLVIDYKTGKRLFMGSNCRVQNELIANRLDYAWAEKPKSRTLTEEQAKEYAGEWRKAYEKTLRRLDAIVSKHPNVSKRFEDFHRMGIASNMGERVMMTCSFHTEQTPKEVMEYVEGEMAKNVRTPYTLSREFGWYMYYSQHEAEKVSGKTQKIAKYKGVIRKGEKGEINLSEADVVLLKKFIEIDKEFQAAGGEREKIVKLLEKYSADIEALNKLEGRQDVRQYIEDVLDPITIKIAIVDSMYRDNSALRDVAKAAVVCNEIMHTHKPLRDKTMKVAEGIETEALREIVMAENRKYVELSGRDITGNSSLKSNGELAEMTDGGQILRKILEPYEGRIVLIDVWGTWCMPCKRAIAKFEEEYRELAGHDIVYMYLANNSDEESWKNIIKEYNVIGENVVHYNLPQGQQEAVEHYLGVRSYPSYRLIDKKGKLLDIKVDARQIESLKELIERIE